MFKKTYSQNSVSNLDLGSDISLGFSMQPLMWLIVPSDVCYVPFFGQQRAC